MIGIPLPPRLRQPRGAVLAVALMVLAVLGLMLTTYVSVDLAHREALSQAALSARVLATAEGGIDLGLRTLEREGPWTGTRTWPTGGGDARVSAAQDGERMVVTAESERSDGIRRAALRIVVVLARENGRWRPRERSETPW